MNIDNKKRLPLSNVENNLNKQSDKTCSNESKYDKDYETLVQFNNSYALAFMGKKPENINKIKILTEDERQVKSAIDKLFRTANNVATKQREANFDVFANSSDENIKKYEEAKEKAEGFYSDKKLYAKFKNLQDTKKIRNKELKEQLATIVKAFESNLNPSEDAAPIKTKNEEILDKLETEVSTKANRFSPTKECSSYGDYIADDLVKLVKQRNEVAKEKGYKNYYELMLNEYGLKNEELQPMFEKMNKATQKAFDNYVKVKPETEKVINSRLCKTNLIGITDEIYQNMGWKIGDMNIGFDLFPRANKSTHAYCFPIDTNKDTRILSNLSVDRNSVETLMHEVGHAVYNLEIDDKLKITDKRIASMALTEGVAMLMESLPTREGALARALELPKDVADNLKESRLSSKASMAKWLIHLANFEQKMYENPDQDLKKLWYDSSNKYYGTKTPENMKNKWAEIPHFITNPAYQPNYLVAEVIVEQLYDAAHKAVGGNLSESKDTAKFFKNKIFKYGSSKTEQEIIKIATGKPLSAEAYCKQFENT